MAVDPPDSQSATVPHTTTSPEQKYLAEYAKAEAAITAAEISCGYTCFSAVNELRCAGRHFADHQVDPTKTDTFEKAINHCHRAIYDAAAEGLYYLLLEFRQFRYDYRSVQISAVIPDYVEETKIFHDAQQLLKEISEDAELERADRHLESQQYFDQMAKTINKFTLAREELNIGIRNDRWKSFGIYATLAAATIVSSFLYYLSTTAP